MVPITSWIPIKSDPTRPLDPAVTHTEVCPESFFEYRKRKCFGTDQHAMKIFAVWSHCLEADETKRRFEFALMTKPSDQVINTWPAGIDLWFDQRSGKIKQTLLQFFGPKTQKNFDLTFWLQDENKIVYSVEKRSVMAPPRRRQEHDSTRPSRLTTARLKNCITVWFFTNSRSNTQDFGLTPPDSRLWCVWLCTVVTSVDVKSCHDEMRRV